MKSIAALLLTIALALFPLSGTRVMAGVQSHAHDVVQEHSHHEHADSHHHGAPEGQAEAAAVHAHAVDDHGQAGATKSPCAGDHAYSSCCSLSCHAMASHEGVGVPAQRHVTMPVGIAALPLPPGIGFDGLLRPPRTA